MKEIGGYFELALEKGICNYHPTPHLLKSGRSALHYLLTIVKPRLVYIPFYTCNSLLAPFRDTGIEYVFYSVNENLDPATSIELNAGEYFLYINYLGLKTATAERLSEKYKDKLIADCTQAFFAKGNDKSWFFNSCRKFFGVPDGSFLYTPSGIQIPVIDTRNEKYIADHLLKRFNGHVNEGYALFQENELLMDTEITGMSKLSRYLLSNIDYDAVIKKRQVNYDFLHERLNGLNKFNAIRKDNNVPMCYPLLLDRETDKRQLYAENIFVPSFWTDVLNRGIDGFEFEKGLAHKLLPLPVDQRYSIADMEKIVQSLMTIIP